MFVQHMDVGGLCVNMRACVYKRLLHCMWVCVLSYSCVMIVSVCIIC